MISDRNRFNRIVKRTARRLSKELDRMCADLREDEAPSAAFECVLIELKRLQPNLMPCLLIAMSDFLEEHARRAAPPDRDGATLH